MGEDRGYEATIEAQLRAWAAELEALKARADRASADVRKDYYEQVDKLRQEIEAKLDAWRRSLESSPAPGGSADADARTLVERLQRRIQAELRDLQPLLGDLRSRAERAETEARRVVNEWRAKREPARQALGELKVGVERAWGELKAALDGALAKFREPS
jgi:hypothetical protein